MRSVIFLAPSIAALLLTALLIFHPADNSAQATQVGTPGQIRQALARARDDAARARQRAEQFDRQARASTRAGERATIEAAALAARVEQAEAALAGAEASLELVRRQHRALNLRLAEERAPVARLMAGLQTLVRRPALLTLAQPGSIADAVHLRAVIAAVQPQIDARTATLRDEIAQARSLERRTTLVAEQRRHLRSDLVSRRRELAAISEAERIKARRASGAADREAERAFAIAESTRDLSSLLRRLSRDAPAVESAPEPPSASGALALESFRLPVAGIRAPNPGAPERGIALLPRPGSVVVAPARGRIAFAGPFRGYGAIVIVEHPGGWTSLLTGLGSVQVSVGQNVIAGSPVGLAPGREPRIGLELRRNGERMNPLDQIR